MNSLVVLAVLPFVYGYGYSYGPHAWKHLHAGQAASAPAASLPPQHTTVASSGNASGPKWRPSGNPYIAAKAPAPQTIHYAVIPIDCRYLTKAAKARMCGRPIMRVAAAHVAKAKAPN